MNRLLFNPFLRLAGMKSLLLGWLVILLTAAISFLSHCHFDGVLDAHVVSGGPWWLYLMEPLVAWLVAVLLFYCAGLMVTRSKVRFIDMAGTLALARWPMAGVALLFLVPGAIPGKELDITFSLIAFSLLILVCSIWMVALMYNAYVVSCSIKGGKAVISFIIALVVAEMLSKIIFYFLYLHVLPH